MVTVLIPRANAAAVAAGPPAGVVLRVIFMATDRVVSLVLK